MPTFPSLKRNVFFNKIDAYPFIQKDEDDLLEAGPENRSLDDLKKSYMARGTHPVIFISAMKKQNIDELRAALMGLVKQTHFIRYPHNQLEADIDFQEDDIAE